MKILTPIYCAVRGSSMSARELLGAVGELNFHLLCSRLTEVAMKTSDFVKKASKHMLALITIRGYC